MRKMDVCYFNLKRLGLVLLRVPSEQHFQPWLFIAMGSSIKKA
jgi:hypothetical protein